MRQVVLLIQLLFSVARRAFSSVFSRAVLPLIRVMLALKRFVCGRFGPPGSAGVFTSSWLPQSHDTISRQRIQNVAALDVCMPSVVPSELHEQEQDAQTPQHAVTPEITPRTPPRPFAPSWFQRYEYRRAVEKKPNKEKIKAGQISFLEDVPDHWERVVHPEGARYYFNARKNVFTDISLMGLANLEELDGWIHFLRAKESQLFSGSSFQKHSTQLVVYLVGSEQWVYYFVNHDTHVVFWIEDFELGKSILSNIHGATEDSHVAYAIEEQYWCHCELYPTCMPLLQEHITEVWGTMAYSYMDTITSVAPLCPFSQDEVFKILHLMPYLQERVCVRDDYAVWILARLMGIIARGRFYHFYGQPGARLEGDMSVYTQQDSSDESSTIFSILDFLLCFSLAAHVKVFRSIWVDGIVNSARWSKLISNLTTEWSGYTIYSTVMLAVNVSFLAVPSVNKGNVVSQSVAIVATYMSLLFVTGSLISSVLLSRQISTTNSSDEASAFMQKITRWRAGTLILGITFSLPYALLVWAVFFFALALFYTIFQTTNSASLSIMILGIVLVTSMISMPIWWGMRCNILISWLSSIKAWFEQSPTRVQESV